MDVELQYLLKEAQAPKKVSKVFSIDEDVDYSLQQLKVGVRSKIVNLALKRVLEENDLLLPIPNGKKTNTTTKPQA